MVKQGMWRSRHAVQHTTMEGKHYMSLTCITQQSATAATVNNASTSPL